MKTESEIREKLAAHEEYLQRVSCEPRFPTTLLHQRIADLKWVLEDSEGVAPAPARSYTGRLGEGRRIEIDEPVAIDGGNTAVGYVYAIDWDPLTEFVTRYWVAYIDRSRRPGGCGTYSPDRLTPFKNP